MSEIFSLVNSMHCSKWHTAWSSIILLSEHFTCSFVTVQRQFQTKLSMQQAPARSAISRLARKFELTGSVCDSKKDVVGRHGSTCTQGSAACVRETLFQNLRKSVTECSESFGIERTSTYYHAMESDVAFLQNPSGTDAQCGLKAAEVSYLGLPIVCAAAPHHLGLPVVSDEPHIHLDGFSDKQKHKALGI